MSDPIEYMLSQLRRYRELSPQAHRDLLSSVKVIEAASTNELRSLLATLQWLADEEPDSDEIAALAHALLAAAAPPAQPGADGREPFDALMVRLMRDLYRRAGMATIQGHLLRLLATDAGPLALEAFADLVAENPPSTRDSIDVAFVPLFQHPSEHADRLFPRLLDALAYPDVASAVLDTANFVTRQGMVAVHPAREQVQRLGTLLSELTQRLQSMTERPPAADEAYALQQRLATSTALFISLCDALALIGDPSVSHRLHPALELRHRRLQTEAAAALARLGDDRGFEVLEGLAAEAVVRNRVLAYLTELDQAERMPAEFRTDVALAEGQLASWLAQPTQFGLAPHEIDLVDSRRLFWPGYDEPVACYLFTYAYELLGVSWTGVGLVGPVTYATAADLEHLTPLEIYATYAGWHAEHSEIVELPAAQIPVGQRGGMDVLTEKLRDQGFASPELVFVGYFFGQRLPVFTAQQAGERGTIVVDDDKLVWYPATNDRQPVTPIDAYNRHKGRRLLENFNADLSD